MKSKPVKFGIKLWVLAGYTSIFFVYVYGKKIWSQNCKQTTTLDHKIMKKHKKRRKKYKLW